jgi:Flp pilus assembly protein TadG
MTRVAPADRLRGDEGTLLIEAAIVTPLLMVFLMALFDFAMLELRQSDLASAARDGARTGIIHWQDADLGTYTGGSCPTSPSSFSAICSSVLQRLAGSSPTTITVQCYVKSSSTTEACANGTITEGLDSLDVTVAYSYRPATIVGETFIGTSHSFTSSARMVIQ